MPETSDLRARIRAALSAQAIARGLEPDRTETAVVPLDAATDAVVAVLDEHGPDDLDQFVREQAAQDPEFATGYIAAQHAATVRAYEDLLGAVSLYVDWRFTTRQLTAEQKTLWADAHDAWAARMDHPEPSKAERWWIDG